MTAGRPHTRQLCPYFCPACDKRLYQHGKATSYRCNCGRSYDLVEGELRPKEKPAQILLSYRGEEVTGAWVIDWEATRHYSTPRIEKAVVYCSADEYEELAS